MEICASLLADLMQIKIIIIPFWNGPLPWTVVFEEIWKSSKLSMSIKNTMHKEKSKAAKIYL